MSAQSEHAALPPALRAWHHLVETKDPAALDALIADDCVFRSPAVFKPQHGKALTTMYLTGAVLVLGPTLQYVDAWVTDDSAVLEFKAELDGLEIHGIDMIRWNDADKITSFTVMVRPHKALEKVIEHMRSQLEALQA